MSSLKSLEKELKSLANPKKALILQRFFKTGPGQYGAGDVFIGLTVPLTRQIAKKYQDLSFQDLKRLLASQIHEFRLTALLILVFQYQRARDLKTKKQIFDFYYTIRKRINNWDLVDLSAPKIFGDYLLVTNQGISRLISMTRSKDLWQRRIAMVSSYSFIRAGRSEEAFQLARELVNDKHDLIHKAVGWMLREAGKRVSEKQLCAFLDQEVYNLPRTSLRYAIERLPDNLKNYYLKIKI